MGSEGERWEEKKVEDSVNEAQTAYERHVLHVVIGTLTKEIYMNTQQQYGATCAVIDGTWVITHIFPVAAVDDGWRFHGYCRPTRAEIEAAGY
jgi:hypothetical protein